jgi:nucleotide-binding universal stress UspA family protein
MNVPANAPQLPFKAVIYATDFSPYSQNAGKYATLLAGKFNADLLVAHAFVLTNPAMEAEAEAGPAVKSAQRKGLENALADVVRQFGEGLQRAVPVLLEGDPRERIPRLAEQNAPSIIVLGTQGRGRIERGIVGSVAERILRATNEPSLTVGPAVPTCEPACAPFRRILFATGLSAAAARGAPYALAMAQAFDASLDVLHVVNPEDVEHPDRISEIQNRFYAALEELVPRQTDDIRNPRDFIDVGSAHVRILEHIKEFQVDLLVLSIRKSSHLWLQSRLSGAFHIIANAPCPVMTITG